jgi:hypothetical protein
VHFKTTCYSVLLFGHHVLIYTGILAVLANMVVAFVGCALGAAARRWTAASPSPLTPAERRVTPLGWAAQHNAGVNHDVPSHSVGDGKRRPGSH